MPEMMNIPYDFDWCVRIYRFVPTAGQETALSGECEIYVFSCDSNRDDGDECGDVRKGVNEFNEIEIEV